jgi:mannose-6-phosphate isomerase-like protein (cupin superfamily)
MHLTRRDLSLLIPALAAAQTAPQSAPQAAPKPRLASKCYKYEDLPVKQNGENASRDVFNGINHTGYPVDLHLTDLGPGMAPHAPHHHEHEEILMLRTGQLDVTILDVTTRITAGSVVYVNSNEEHGWRNPGPSRAEYFVMAIGRSV